MSGKLGSPIRFADSGFNDVNTRIVLAVTRACSLTFLRGLQGDKPKTEITSKSYQ